MKRQKQELFPKVSINLHATLALLGLTLCGGELLLAKEKNDFPAMKPKVVVVLSEIHPEQLVSEGRSCPPNSIGITMTDSSVRYAFFKSSNPVQAIKLAFGPKTDSIQAEAELGSLRYCEINRIPIPQLARVLINDGKGAGKGQERVLVEIIERLDATDFFRPNLQKLLPKLLKDANAVFEKQGGKIKDAVSAQLEELKTFPAQESEAALSTWHRLWWNTESRMIHLTVIQSHRTWLVTSSIDPNFKNKNTRSSGIRGIDASIEFSVDSTGNVKASELMISTVSGIERLPEERSQAPDSGATGETP